MGWSEHPRHGEMACESRFFPQSRESNSVCQAWLLSHVSGPLFISYFFLSMEYFVYSCVPLHQNCANLLCIISILVNSTTEASPYLNTSFHLGRILLATELRQALNLAIMFSPSKKLESWAWATTLGFYRLSTKTIILLTGVFLLAKSQYENERDR